MTFKIGDRVRAEREAPAKGSWSRYAGKVGTVVRINQDDNEFGVVLGPPALIREQAKGNYGRVVWFLPNELVPAGQRHSDSPHSGST